jgi:hypothetical protein
MSEGDKKETQQSIEQPKDGIPESHHVEKYDVPKGYFS